MNRFFAAIENWIDSGMALTPTLKALLLFTTVTIIIGYMGYQAVMEVKPAPCAPSGNPARCYRISQRMCEPVWTNAEVKCKEFVRKLALPPGRLVGPIVMKCQLSNLDQAFNYARKSIPDCQGMFSDLDDWKKRNDFK
jgi:hypothetical protein